MNSPILTPEKPYKGCHIEFHVCYVQGGRLIQVKTTKQDNRRTATGWPRPINRGGRLIKVTNSAHGLY